MKKLELKHGKIIETPWLRIGGEAAAYCGLARSTFTERAGDLPHGGDRTIKLYHCEVLDRFINGETPETPFIMKQERPHRRSRPHFKGGDTGGGLIDPGTGKVYRSR